MFNIFNLIAPAEAVNTASPDGSRNVAGSGGTDFMSYLAAVMEHVDAKEKAAAGGAKIDGKNILGTSEKQALSVDLKDPEVVSALEAFWAAYNADSDLYGQEQAVFSSKSSKDSSDSGSVDELISALEAAIQAEALTANKITRTGEPADKEPIRPVIAEEDGEDEESADTRNENDDGVFHAEIVSASFFPSGGKKISTPTAEEYISRFEEMLRAAGNAAATVRSEIYVDGGKKEDDKPMAVQEVEASKGHMFETEGGEYVAVLPSKEAAVSEMAAELTDEALAEDGSEGIRDTAVKEDSKSSEFRNINTELKNNEAHRQDVSRMAEVKETKPGASEQKLPPQDLNVEDIELELAAKEQPKEQPKNTEQAKTEPKTAEVKPELSPDKQVADGRQAQHKQVNAAVSDIVDKQNAAKDARNSTTNTANEQPKVNPAESAHSQTGSGGKDGGDKENKFVNILENKLENKAQQSPQAPLAEGTENKEGQQIKFDDAEPLQAKAERAEVRTVNEPQPQPSKGSDATMRWQNIKDVQELTRMVQQAGKDGVNKLTVRLTPEHLGRLEIQLTEVGGRIDAKIMASSQESRAVLASHGEIIRQQLLEKGIHIDNMDFSFHDSLARQNQNDLHKQHKQHKQPKSGGNFRNGGADEDGENDEPVEPRIERGAIYA